MAHTFALYYGSYPALNLQSATAAGGVGYGLLSYAPGVRTEMKLDNSSLYTDGERTVFRRTPNTIDTIRLHVKGSTANELAGNLRALDYALYVARDCTVAPLERNATYLAFAPQGTTNTAYKIVYGGVMQMPETYLASAVDVIEVDVTLLLETEPFWREKPPTHSATKTVWSTNIYDTPNIGHVGEVAVSSTPGDVPALTHFTISPVTTAFDRVRIGYSSLMRKGAAHNAAGLIELTVAGADTGAIADAQAQGGSVLRCTFAGTPTDDSRATVNQALPPGTFRCLARMRCDVGDTVTAYLKYKQSYSVQPAFQNASVSVVGDASYRIYDLGIVRNPPAATGSLASTTAAYVELAVWAAGVSGADLRMDILFLMPIDEYYIDSQGIYTVVDTVTYGYRFDNIAPVPPFGQNVGLPDGLQSDIQHTGDLQLPPGDGTLYYCITDRNYSGLAFTFPLDLYRCARYLGPRGAG